ncbi:MAG: hypothetical protein AUF79_05715 [Crenarchaeota archaeon 13_1_20CM_2_51_8]|nr:MAG: hypothetical protein AUI97_07285 [Crenarchaeota archaeon 13_1_40CM_3_52_17]OLE91249.1 MAG: hypothetical protein AUF79_05715 [Crenarchaeota archaeon 13_1_20CM_2_51_8]
MSERSRQLFSTIPWSGEFARLVLMGAAALFSFSGLEHIFVPYDLVAITATLLGGIPVYRETVHSLRRRRVTMEVSMTVAIVACLIIREFTAAVIITFFVLLAESIEEYAVDRARNTVFQLGEGNSQNCSHPPGQHRSRNRSQQSLIE